MNDFSKENEPLEIIIRVDFDIASTNNALREMRQVIRLRTSYLRQRLHCIKSKVYFNKVGCTL